MTFKSLLTGVAALLLATGTVHAGDALISGQEQGSCGPYKEPPSRGQLPEAILGDWCSKEGSFDTQVVYTRGIDCEDPEEILLFKRMVIKNRGVIVSSIKWHKALQVCI